MTDSRGVVTEFRMASFTNDLSKMNVRRMDCMDCHNRPAHVFRSPESAVNLAMSLGQIDRSLPFVKTNAVGVLCGKYTNQDQAFAQISATMHQRYPTNPTVGLAIDSLKQIYQDNFFPEMKSDWRAYPDNIGHKDWPGCFRCHDGKHKTVDGTRTIRFNDCNVCHVILAQGSGEQMNQLSSQGQKFAHPLEEYDPAYQCTDCHNGGL